MTKRYGVYNFPAKYGSEFRTNWYIIAILTAIWCYFWLESPEIRIIDDVTKKHRIL